MLKELNSGAKFESNKVETHINACDYSRLKKKGNKIGFRKVINSKPGGSVSKELQGPDIDVYLKEISLFVDLVK